MPPSPMLLLMLLVQINIQKTVMLFCCSVHLFHSLFAFFSLSPNHRHSKRSVVCVLRFVPYKRMFAFAFALLHHFLPLLFGNFRFVDSQAFITFDQSERTSGRAHDARISHSIELNEMVFFSFSRSLHIEELLSTYVNVCIDAKSGIQQRQ